jgi:hypothetical protein
MVRTYGDTYPKRDLRLLHRPPAGGGTVPSIHLSPLLPPRHRLSHPLLLGIFLTSANPLNTRVSRYKIAATVLRDDRTEEGPALPRSHLNAPVLHFPDPVGISANGFGLSPSNATLLMACHSTDFPPSARQGWAHSAPADSGASHTALSLERTCGTLLSLAGLDPGDSPADHSTLSYKRK